MCRSEGSVLSSATVLPADMPSHQLIKPMKPRLPRKLANSARINLNKYWHALEELIPVSRKVFDESDCNAINENIDNEHRLAAMQLSDSQTPSEDGNGKGSSAKPSALTTNTQNGKTSSTSSFHGATSEPFSLMPEFPPFRKTAVATSLQMTMDIPFDENTPPTSAFIGTSSR
ncbi:hypothetical protein J6590_027132 [Homalodisca vitripennis]|nr:hypothetical protein J6590_027132 [Homalodisca vitripennis]